MVPTLILLIKVYVDKIYIFVILNFRQSAKMSENSYLNFLKTEEFMIFIEKIVSVYSEKLLTVLRNEIAKSINDSVQVLKENLISDCRSDSSGFSTPNGFMLSDKIKNEINSNFHSNRSENNASGEYKECDTRYSTDLFLNEKQSFDNKSLQKETESIDLTESARFENGIRDINLSKKDYYKSMVLGVYSKDVISNKIVFESYKKRYCIHLENCKARTRSEKKVITKLEESLQGKAF